MVDKRDKSVYNHLKSVLNDTLFTTDSRGERKLIESEWTDSDAAAVAKCHIFSACGGDAVRGLWEHLGGKVCDFSGGEADAAAL